MSARRARWSPIERELRAVHGPLVAGVDEVGRGPLAGPVVACALVMPCDRRAISGVDDSKRLLGSERERLAELIRQRAVALGLGAASAREIDRVNIYHATVLAMRRALGRLGLVPDHVVVDGNPIRTLGVAHTAVVHGDARCYQVACASIVAKVTRDRLMRALAPRYPDYRWERNVGYGTAEHGAGIVLRGITRHHRVTFISAWRSYCGDEQAGSPSSADVGRRDVLVGEGPPGEPADDEDLPASMPGALTGNAAL